MSGLEVVFAVIPYRRLSLSSMRPASELVDQLASVSGPTRRQSRKAIVFGGFVRGTSFRLVLNEEGRNTYAPLIRGEVVDLNNGSCMAIVMTMHPIGGVATSAFFGAIFLGTNSFLTAFLVCLGFHGVMCLVGFWPSARRAEAALRYLVESGGRGCNGNCTLRERP